MRESSNEKEIRLVTILSVLDMIAFANKASTEDVRPRRNSSRHCRILRPGWWCWCQSNSQEGYNAKVVLKMQSDVQWIAPGSSTQQPFIHDDS
jgi:hypothetical protein